MTYKFDFTPIFEAWPQLLAGVQQYRSREMARMQVGPFQQVVERMRNWFSGNF